MSLIECLKMKIFRSNECYIHQARSYLYVKCAAVYTFSSQRGYFKMFKSAIKTWPNYRGNLQQVKSNITKLIDFISDNVCDCSISWHYSVNAFEYQGQLLAVSSIKCWPKRLLILTNMRGQGCNRAAKHDYGSNELVDFKKIEKIVR